MKNLEVHYLGTVLNEEFVSCSQKKKRVTYAWASWPYPEIAQEGGFACLGGEITTSNSVEFVALLIVLHFSLEC